MIKLLIDDIIGFGYISNASIVEKLQSIAPGEDIEIEIDSPGGSIFECISIFNTIREYAKTHPVLVFINVAASAASVIAIAPRTVNPDAVIKVSENSIYFIHNPLDFIFGDYREMRKKGDYLFRLAAMFAGIYAGVTGQSSKKIQQAMDDETYYIGKEIKEAGFANTLEIINPGAEVTAEARAAIIAKAEMSIVAAKKKLTESQETAAELEKAVAMLEMSNNVLGIQQGDAPKNNGGSLPAGINNNKPEGKMTPEELLAQNPECYKAVFALGQNAERERVMAHLKLAEKAQCYETAAKFIKDGASTLSEAVASEYLAQNMNAQHTQNRIGDNPAPINTPDNTADDAAVMAAFEGGYMGKAQPTQGRK